VSGCGQEQPKSKPQRLNTGLDCDSDPVRRQLKTGGIKLTCSYRKNWRNPRTQDGRKPHRLRRRWKVERAFAWLGN
jgi:hypothetical protein